MSAIKFYVISCSSDKELNVSDLYVWGEMGHARWLPQSIKEARKRIDSCHCREECLFCDAEIHEIEIPCRKKTTYKQSLSVEKTAS